ncbi:MAG TPA: ElyC/SanA/YdcF family protein [Fimbriimonas sp.]|nr:ElyC/SanA/YdcF family protein [Fimbriimonas sp.]
MPDPNFTRFLRLSTKAKRRILFGAGGLIAASSLFILYTNQLVASASQGRIYLVATDVPQTRVALVLGTAPMVSGRPNAYFVRRISAAAELYRSGRIEKILVSGDNGRRGYDEPTAMKNALMARGVPAEDVTCDFAGFHTLDSIIRAKEVFGLEKCVIVTDDFHLPRALYTAQQKGLSAIGFQTESFATPASTRLQIREVGSRLLVWLDCNVLNSQPKFLGPHESI